ncbi:MAG TPA: DUF6350 family protein [Actinomycetota bacterium]|nr:DUF6350 family protein [Actinomycetota bacterium]
MDEGLSEAAATMRVRGVEMSAGPPDTETVEIGASSLVRRGWPQAIRGALLAALCVAAAGQIVAFLALLAGALGDASAGQAARYGWALFYAFHHVGLAFRSPDLRLPAHAERVLAWPGGYAVDAVLAFALLSGTALSAWLLMRAGRSIGRAVGGPELRRGIHGAKVAVPYAILSWVASWGLSVRLRLPDASPLSVHSSHLAAFFWPLTLAVAFGLVGGIRSAGEGIWTSPWIWETETWPRRWHGAVRGGLWMLGLGLSLSLVGLGILALADADRTASLVDTAFHRGVGTGLAVVLLGLLALPNAAAWTLVPAMGGCLEVGGGAGSSLPPYCFLSYGSFFGHRLPDTFISAWGYPELGPSPRGFLFFLLVPAITVLAGGILAARRAEVRGRLEGALVGAMAGTVFAVCLTALLILALVTARFHGPLSYVATGYFRYGPYPPYGLELGLAWGCVGGAIGGLVGAIRTHRSRRVHRAVMPS